MLFNNLVWLKVWERSFSLLSSLKC